MDLHAHIALLKINLCYMCSFCAFLLVCSLCDESCNKANAYGKFWFSF